MEQCVKDSTIDKVLILSDKLYAEKANSRKGGVGDETAIITAEVYGHVKQTKFNRLSEYSGKRCYPNKFFIRRMPENAGECKPKP